MTDKERIEKLVIVDKMPDSCYFCKHSHVNSADGASCSLLHGKEIFCNFTDMAMSDRYKNCPLKTIQSVQNHRAIEALAEAERRLYESHYHEEREGKHSVYMEEVQSVIDKLIKEYGGNNASTIKNL